MSKVKFSCVYPDVSPCWDKCKRDDASFIHMYWSCPSLEKNWKDVFQTLSQILSLDLAPGPLVALSGVTTEVRLTPVKWHSILCLSIGQTCGFAEVERHSPTHTLSVVGRNHVLFKSWEDQILSLWFRWNIPENTRSFPEIFLDSTDVLKVYLSANSWPPTLWRSLWFSFIILS